MGTILTRSRSEVTTCPSADEWIRKLWCIYTMERCFTMDGKEIRPFADAQMDLESIVLGGVGPSDGDRCRVILLICGI